jgi:signal transduction histidine kinase/CheY-like chemotaxis protein
MILGLFLSPSGYGPFWTSVVNRTLGTSVVFIVAVIGLAARRTLHLQEANRKLELEIGERERIQAQLLHSQRLESVGVLASGIAHDFNNLLTPILMTLKLLKEDRPKEERQQLLITLQAGAERGAETVRKLLAFAGSTDGPREIIHTKHIINETIAILKHTLPKTIWISVNLANNLMAVCADTTHLSQVLMNLCVNARDAMPTGGRLAIGARNVRLGDDGLSVHIDARRGPYVRIDVTDNGSGIPLDVLHKVFDPFFTTKEPGKGTGLGLSTAMGIVRAHGGFITAFSEVGKGSRFAIYLPAVDEVASHQTPRESRDMPRGQGELILIVDDEPFILAAARLTLEGCGYRVVTARDGTEAIHLYQQQSTEIKAVVLDLMMPEMDGHATMKTLRELNSEVRIVVSSGLLPTGRKAKDLGSDTFLPKPYTDEQLLTILARALKTD